jgi:hypothetical protein
VFRHYTQIVVGDNDTKKKEIVIIGRNDSGGTSESKNTPGEMSRG